MTTEFDISFEWRRGIFARFRQHDGKHIETMPVPDEFVRWREGKTEQLSQFLTSKERNDRLANKRTS